MSLQKLAGSAVVCLLSLGLLSPAGLAIWEYVPLHGLVRASVPGTLSARSPVHEADLDGDGEIECLRLSEGSAQVYSGSCASVWLQVPVWESPEDWDVRDAQISDLDGDGWMEVTLLVWRGFKPWPIDRYLLHPGYINDFQDQAGRSCHLILISGRNCEGYCELWAGSALAKPLQAFTTADLDGDGRQELVVLETAYDATADSTAQALAVWQWNGFGFNLQSRIEGVFRDLLVLKGEDGGALILTGYQ